MGLIKKLNIFKNKLFRKKGGCVITTRELANVMLKERIISVPIYKEKNQRELIVMSRDIHESKNLKKKKTIKL